MKINKIYYKIIAIFVIFIFAAFHFSRLHKKPNIILIIIDCLRADHLGCYGYLRNTSPNIDKFAQGGVLFNNTFSQGAFTFASLPSILTSKIPLSHGVWYLSRGHMLSDEEVTLAEILKGKGYVTAAFTGGAFTSQIFGFSQGFDIYKEVNWGDIKDINRLALNWLETEKKKPFFVLMHCYTVHDPFSPPEPFNKMYAGSYRGRFKDKILDNILFDKLSKYAVKEKIPWDQEDLDYIISQYDGEIRYCDFHTGDFLTKIKKLGLDSDTIIILTSDHGEDLMEHGTISHGDVYDVGTRIPLILKNPHLLPKNKKVDTLAGSIDILPTILDICGIPLKQDTQGISLLPFILGKEEEKERFIFSLGVAGFSGECIRMSIRNRDRKLIFSHIIGGNNTYEFYNLKEDPGELNNLASVEKEQFALFEQKLHAFLKQSKPPTVKSKLILDEKTKERLRSLGYVQ
ncbi:MAG: hypothetical protein A2166_05170 [Omnitrophica WOR_2 bacterium RBG_13_41_10]|nr:MAG: hypothetical protein A2166_05170 [Omnitrophica WOR_2 bacterium RBG_13_41_10]